MTIGTQQPITFPATDQSPLSESGSSNVTATITITYTWSGSGTPPKTLNVLEIGGAGWSSVTGPNGSAPSASSSDGLGDTEVDDNYRIGNPPTNTVYQGNSGGTWSKQLQVSGNAATDTVTLKAAFKNGSSGDCGISLSASIAPQAVPVKWTTKGIVDGAGTGTLQFQYSWSSSDGVLADTKGCFIHEYVVFPGPLGTDYQPPLPFGPPWAAKNPNPTISPVPSAPAEAGSGITDNQLYATPLNQAFVKPYSNCTDTATQYWEYDDTRSGVNDIVIAGPITITRTVAQVLIGPNVWAYWVSKSGYTSSLLYLP